MNRQGVDLTLLKPLHGPGQRGPNKRTHCASRRPAFPGPVLTSLPSNFHPDLLAAWWCRHRGGRESSRVRGFAACFRPQHQTVEGSVRPLGIPTWLQGAGWGQVVKGSKRPVRKTGVWGQYCFVFLNACLLSGPALIWCSCQADSSIEPIT